MKKLAAALVIAAAAYLAGFGYGRWYGPKEAGIHAERKEKRGYHCPMHPQVRSDRPGDCPICGMKLVPDEAPAAAPAQHGKVLYYHDPASPSYRSDKPGLNPETGNDLVPVYEQPAEGTVTIPSDKQQWIGLKTAAVEPHAGSETLRVPGRIAADETRIVKVQTRFEGWIEKVYVDFTGRLVRKGEPLFTLYSPELTASQEEYLLARKARQTLEGSSVPGMRDYNATLERTARARLEHHWGLDAASIEELERSGQPRKTVTIHAPANGFVLMRNAYPSTMVKPEMETYTLADLSRVWILADVFESDAARIQVGMTARVEPSYAPGRSFRAQVTNILPQIDTQTRTLKIRLEAENPDYTLRPDLFVNVEFAAAMAARLAVPEDAVIDSGEKQIVYVDLGEGRFEPRRVETGEHFDGRVEILAGLKKGERIVVSGAFLVDSESQLRRTVK